MCDCFFDRRQLTARLLAAVNKMLVNVVSKERAVYCLDSCDYVVLTDIFVQTKSKHNSNWSWLADKHMFKPQGSQYFLSVSSCGCFPS